MAARVAESMVELIGNTPMVRLRKVAKGALVYAKLELFNPGGSVKDRIGLAMLADAERKGLVKPGGTIVEPTSGNTGMGLALAAKIKGYKVVFTVPDKMSKDKIDLLRAVGAKVRVTPSNVPPGHPENYIQVARAIAAETPNSFLPNQYENPANPAAHYSTTGPEIWEQTGGRVDALVAGVGTGGTISGTGRYLKEMKPSVKVVGVDPEGSILAQRFRGKKGTATPYRVEGIGEDFTPKTLDMRVIDEFLTVSDREAMLMTRRLAREEGILAGTSSGAAVAGAVRVAGSLARSSTVVVIIPDTGRSYLGKVYNDQWMAQQGFSHSSSKRVSVAAILRSKSKGTPAIVSASPGASTAEVARLMARYGVTRLPVVSDGVQVGGVTAMGLVKALAGKGNRLRVSEVMEEPFPTIPSGGKVVVPDGPLGQRGILVVLEGGKPSGIITPGDVVRYLATK